MQYAVSEFTSRLRVSLTPRALLKARISPDEFPLTWLGDDAVLANEASLYEDQKVLRALEADVYALNDQFKTETQHGGGALP